MPALEFAGQPGGWLCLRAKALGLAEGDEREVGHFPCACSHVTLGFMSANAPRGFSFQAHTCNS